MAAVRKIIFLFFLVSLLNLSHAQEENPEGKSEPCCIPGKCWEEGCCNPTFLMFNLKRLFPAPTRTTNCKPVSTVPCCGSNCIDGACRLIPVFSKKPQLTSKPKSGENRAINVITGCCRGCKECEQGVIITTRQFPDKSKPKPSNAPYLAVNNDPKPATTSPAQRGNLDDTQGGQEHILAAGVYCFGACEEPCYNCDKMTAPCTITARVHPQKAVLKSTPNTGTGRVLDSLATATATFNEKTSLKSGSIAAEPTFILPDSIADTLAGRSQNQIVFTVDNVRPEPVAVIGTVDMKVRQNYISQFALLSLGLLSSATPFPKDVEPSGAILDKSTLNQTFITETIVLNCTFTSARIDPKTYQPSLDPDDTVQKSYYNIRFSIYKTNVYNTQLSDVILGSILLGEIHALSIAGIYRRPVKDNTPVVGRLIHGELWGQDPEPGQPGTPGNGKPGGDPPEWCPGKEPKNPDGKGGFGEKTEL